MENLQNLNQHIETLNKTIKSLEKKLNIKLADEEEKSKILNKMLDELTNTHSPNVDRFEGFYTYIVSNKLESLIREKNWLVGVILSASIIDDLGKRKLKRSFKGKINPDKIERLQFDQTIMLLLVAGLIDDRIYQKLMEIKEARNSLAHDSSIAMFAYLDTGLEKNDNCRKYKSVIRKAIFCLNSIYPQITP